MPLDYDAERDMLVSSPPLSSSRGVGLHLLEQQGCLLLLPSLFNTGGQPESPFTSHLLFRLPDSFPALALIAIIDSQGLGFLAREWVTRRK